MKYNIDPNYLISERKRIGAEIRAIREAKGLSMQQLADEMGTSKSTISKIEAGNWSASIDVLSSFGVYLDFKVEVKKE